MEKKLCRIDNILWDIDERNQYATPLCLIHRYEMDPYDSLEQDMDIEPGEKKQLKCDKCKKTYPLDRRFGEEIKYVFRILASKDFKQMQVMNLDDEALPVAKNETPSRDSKYFIKSLLTRSKLGLRLVVYAGEKGRKEKTQIFIEPGMKRLAFDQKDLHPNDVFSKLEATFVDGTKAILKKNRTRIK